MSRSTALLSLILFSVCALWAPATARAADPFVTELIAGQNTVIGTVTVTNDGTEITVIYDVTDTDWCLTKAHLYVGAEPPKKAAPGSFPYKADLDCVTTFTFTVPVPDGADCVYIAAHADSQCFLGYDDPDIDLVLEALPESATIVVRHPGGDSYFNTTVSGTGTLLDGTFDGFCVDTGHNISPGLAYAVEVYSSYDPLLPPIVDHPENLDLVNWIINQGYVGTASPGGYGIHTYGDVQRAIWELVENSQSTSGLGSWNQARADEIVADALAYGEGFVPGCGESVAIILRPVNSTGDTVAQVTIAQVTFVELGIECPPIYCEETAWAWVEGAEQFKQGWGWTFEYCCD